MSKVKQFFVNIVLKILYLKIIFDEYRRRMPILNLDAVIIADRRTSVESKVEGNRDTSRGK
jgi:hypothetical protein